MAGNIVLLLLVLMRVGCLALGFLHNLHEGDNCYNHNNMPGICTKVRKCPNALYRIITRKIRFKHCSYEQEPVICCESTSPTHERVIMGKPQTASQRLMTESFKIAEKKCQEYGEYAYVTRVLETLTVIPEIVRELVCPIVGQDLIVGGKEAQAGEFPHMVALGYLDKAKASKVAWSCGGSLISEQFVLTAAHCRSREGVQVSLARLGALNLEKYNEKTDPKTVNVIDFIKHENYKYPSKYNDIALVKLERVLVLGVKIRPACLHTRPEDLAGVKYLTASGWGLTHANNDDVSDVLMKVSLHLFPHAKCQKAYPSSSVQLRQGINDSSMICAGDPVGLKDTCSGDSGGPMQVRRVSPTCTYSIVAVTSFGSNECVSDKQPGLYTRVFYYVPWIQRHVWP